MTRQPPRTIRFEPHEGLVLDARLWLAMAAIVLLALLILPWPRDERTAGSDRKR